MSCTVQDLEVRNGRIQCCRKALLPFYSVNGDRIPGQRGSVKAGHFLHGSVVCELAYAPSVSPG